MRQIQLARIVTAAMFAVGLVTGRASAQQTGTGLTVGLGFAAQYPDRFQEGCGNPASAVPWLGAHRRVHRLLTAEVDVSGHIQIPPGQYCSADAIPLVDGDLVRQYQAGRGSVSLAGEARLVFTPVRIADGDVRLIGGGAWYVARSTPAWIMGAGYRPLTSWGAFVLDVERWDVGVAYELERFRSGAPRERVGDGREWQALWQVRVGMTVWTR